MRKYWRIVLFVTILIIASLACTISKNSTPIPSTIVPLTLTITCTPTVIPVEIGIVNPEIVEIGLNLRKDSTENSELITTLKPNSIVFIKYRTENGWICVDYKDENGKIFNGFVNATFISSNIVSTPTK